MIAARRLDRDGKGFVTLRDWGAKGLERTIRAFTRMYVQATRGASGRSKDTREIQSMHMAVQLAMAKMKLKNHGKVCACPSVRACAHTLRVCVWPTACRHPFLWACK